MPSSNFPPSPISQDSPGICANAPIAASTSASSAITTPIPNTPAIAPGTKEATALNANIIAESRPMPAMPFTSVSTSIPLSASTMPEKNAIRTSMATLISSGRFFAIPSNTLIRNWKIESTIDGVYFTSASNTAAINASAPSAI